MRIFLILAVVGLAAQLVDGSLGMAYGVASQRPLLAVVGLSPAIASAAVRIAEVPWQVVGALLLGGVIAAPIAAYIVRILPARVLGTAVGGIILVTNTKTFLEAVGISGPLATVVYVLIVAVWISALVFSIRVNQQEKGKPAKGERNLA